MRVCVCARLVWSSILRCRMYCRTVAPVDSSLARDPRSTLVHLLCGSSGAPGPPRSRRDVRGCAHATSVVVPMRVSRSVARKCRRLFPPFPNSIHSYIHSTQYIHTYIHSYMSLPTLSASNTCIRRIASHRIASQCISCVLLGVEPTHPPAPSFIFSFIFFFSFFHYSMLARSSLDGLAYLPVYLPTYLPTCLPTCLPTRLLAYLLTRLPTYVPRFFLVLIPRRGAAVALP